MNNKLLEQYIASIVKEELQKEDTITAAFIDPLKDIWDTFKAGVEDMSVRTQAFVKTLWRGLGTLFIPFLDADYKEIEKEEKERLEAVQKKYADVFARNDDAFYNTDLMPLTFLKNPQMFLGAKLVEKAPGTVVNALEVLTGGHEKVKQLKQWLISIGIINKDQTSAPDPRSKSGSQDLYHFAQNAGMGNSWGNMDARIDYGSYSGSSAGDLEEAAPAQQTQQQPQNKHAMAVQYVKKLLNDKDVQAALNNSQIAQNMKKDALSIYLVHATKFLGVKSLDQLMQQFGNKLGNLKTTIDKNLKKAKPEEIEEIKTAVLAQLKTQYKDYYIKKIGQMAQQDPSLQAAATDVISRIKALN